MKRVELTDEEISRLQELLTSRLYSPSPADSRERAVHREIGEKLATARRGGPAAGQQLASLRSMGSVSQDGKEVHITFYLLREGATLEQTEALVTSGEAAQEFALDVIKNVARAQAVSELFQAHATK